MSEPDSKDTFAIDSVELQEWANGPGKKLALFAYGDTNIFGDEPPPKEEENDGT